jgi:endonuclease YncB( thermonuclease family)
MKKITDLIAIIITGLLSGYATTSCYWFLYKPPQETKITEHAVIANIYDGDTVSIQFTKEYPIRLLNCWAPEITGKEKTEGLKSREYLKSILKPGDKIIIDIPTTNKFEDSVSFGRILGNVYKDIDNDGKLDNISEVMVKNGFAKSKK